MNYEILKNIREDRDLTQQEVADVLNIKVSAYGKYERGINMMGVDKYIILARFYDVSLDYLLGVTDRMKPLTPRRSEENRMEIASLYNAYKSADRDIKRVVNILLKIRR